MNSIATDITMVANKKPLLIYFRASKIILKHSTASFFCVFDSAYEMFKYLILKCGYIYWTTMATTTEPITLPLVHVHGVIMLMSVF